MNNDSKLLSSKSGIIFDMVIDVLNDNLIQGLPFDKSDNLFHKNHVNSVRVISLKYIISQFTLNLKQSVAFEIITSSFVQKSLQIHSVTKQSIEIYFKDNENKGTHILTVFPY